VVVATKSGSPLSVEVGQVVPFPIVEVGQWTQSLKVEVDQWTEGPKVEVDQWSLPTLEIWRKMGGLEPKNGVKTCFQVVVCGRNTCLPHRTQTVTL
jgi:hypothetical protein